VRAVRLRPRGCERQRVGKPRELGRGWPSTEGVGWVGVSSRVRRARRGRVDGGGAVGVRGV
jgi:hypothetical protein